jgi:hypothetical protein
MPALVQDVPHGTDRVARFAILDPALAGTVHPDRVVIEITNDFPDFRGWLAEDGAVIGACHGRDSLLESRLPGSMNRRPWRCHPISDASRHRPLLEPIEISSKTAT